MSRNEWPLNPDALVGKRVEMEWSQGKVYKGKVTRYSANTRVHTVFYDDGEEKYYDMFSKTFRIEGESKWWTPSLSRQELNDRGGTNAAMPTSQGYGYGNYGYGGYGNTGYNTGSTYGNAYSNVAAPKYVSRVAGASTNVTFHVILDARALQEGDRVVLNGSPAELTDWGDGIAMLPAFDNPMIWTATVNLPFGFTDHCLTGIFSFRYEIVTVSGNIIEGQNDRFEQGLQWNFYHIFRSNFRYPRFKGWTAMSGKQAFMQFCAWNLDKLRRGDCTLNEYFDLHSNLTASVADAKRFHVEELFENELQDANNRDVLIDTNLLIAYLGSIGSFGLTSDENVYTAGTGGGYSYSYVNGAQVSNPTYAPTTLVKRKPPKPTMWAYYCAENLDVTYLYGLKWADEFGVNSRWIAKAIVEVIERFSEHALYDWLRIIPLASKHQMRPRICFWETPASSAGGKKDSNESDFEDMARSICGMIDEQSSIAVAHKGNKEAEAIIKNALSLAREWLQALILYAPSIERLSSLLIDSAQDAIGRVAVSSKSLQAALVSSIATRIEDEKWTSKSLVVLEGLLHGIRLLCSPRIASALLKNGSVDYDTRAVISLVSFCLQDLTWVKAATAAVQEEHKDGTVTEAVGAPVPQVEISTEEGSADALISSGLEGEWHELNVAAKEWISRKHKAEPAPEMVAVEDKSTKSNNPYGWPFSGWSNQIEKRPKKLTLDEQKTQHRTHFQSALVDIESLFTIPFFFSNPNGILFELGRCWFLKANDVRQHHLVLNSLCFVGDKNGSRGFSVFPGPLAHYLETRTLREVKECNAISSSNVIQTVETMTDIFKNSSELGHKLLHYLALLVGWPHAAPETVTDGQSPSLVSILEKAEFWEYLHTWASQAISSPLTLLLQTVTNHLSKVASAICDHTCCLADMHVVMRYERSFLSLCNALGVVETWPRLLSNLDPATEEVRKFDTYLEYVQIYVSFFCTCGTNIDASDVRARIESLRHRYASLRLNELGSAFNGILVMPHISWLYKLRGSELFLQQWKSAGRRLCIDSVEGAREIMESGNMNAGAEDGLADEANEALTQLHREDGEEEDAFAQRVAALEAALVDRVNAQFQIQDRRNEILQRVEDVVLSQEIVVHMLIPIVKGAWMQLASDTFTGVITIKALDQFFSNMTSEIHIAEELKLLSTSESTEGIDGEEKSSGSLQTAMRDNLERSLFSIKDYHLLRKLRAWLPALIKLHEALGALFSTSLEDDIFRKTLQTTYHTISTKYDQLTLALIPQMVEALKGTFDRYTIEQLDFLSMFSGCPDLIAWLLNQSSTEEFNRLLQVVRPCTDEPRMLSAIASLVHIRTMLISILYVTTPYGSFEVFLDAFGDGVELQGTADSGSALWHLNNIISTFDGLMEVFEKQTRSPGIKSCYDLKDILDRGTFVLKGSVSQEKVLVLELSGKATGDSAEPSEATEESIDYLLDLRSKLLMTEIPPELEEEMKASVMVDAFVQQLQILSEICDVIVNLHISGHMQYQEEFAMRIKFEVDGQVAMQKLLESLQEEAGSWEYQVKRTRTDYYYLNFYSMREILKFRFLLTSALEEPVEVDEVALDVPTSVRSESIPPPLPPPSSLTPPPDDMDMLVDNLEQMGFSKDWALVALKRTGGNIEAAIEFCFNNTHNMDRLVAEDYSTIAANAMGYGGGGGGSGVSEDIPAVVDLETSLLDAAVEIHNLLHLVSSSVSFEKVTELISLWKENAESDKPFLTILGQLLGSIFEVADGPAEFVTGRCINLPDENAKNKADMLVLVNDESEKRLPVFVACTESPPLVFDTVLSVYVRRGRLPEPGEIMFCTAQTVIEDINLMFLRFISSKKHGRAHAVFCIADIHNLSYTLQCALVERLRITFAEHGHENAATLLIVSGMPRQVALNALSAHAVDLPPLDMDQLQKSCEEAFRLHVGPTQCVASTINGGGKTHYILNVIADCQRSGETLLYRKIPIREGTTPKSLVELMSAAAAVRQKVISESENPSERVKVAFHIDIAHIIPPAANTMLFQLLLVGVLRDPLSSRVYFRNPDDVYMIELPNSIGNKSIKALRFCSMLPYTLLEVNVETLELSRPAISRQSSHWPYKCPGTRVLQQDFYELRYTCRWLRAIKGGMIRYGSDTYIPVFSPSTDADVTKQECFDLLTETCCKVGGPSPHPSFAMFYSFIMFTNMQFNALENYPLLQNEVLTTIDGLQNFKHVFVDLLLETSKDFSLRSVSQVAEVGPQIGSIIVGGTIDLDNGDNFAGTDLDLPPPPGLVMQTSSELRRATQEASVLSTPAMVRQTSEEVVKRFANMISWEESEHPIVAFKMNRYGEALAVDILSLNPQFVDRHIHGPLKHSLEENSFDFNKDWDRVTNEEGVSILRQIEGLDDDFRGGLHALEPGYVMTVDNILKMLSIQLRLRCNLPVVIMGETGCGKSTLIRNMCAILGTPLHILNIHGGMEDVDIIKWMQDKMGIASRLRNPLERVVVLLDEINTCNCMGLFKEIVCDRTLNGQPLPDKIKIIAACNPYRLRTTQNLYGGEEMAGLVFEHFVGPSNMENVGTGIRDPLRKLVYRVHPLPESMIDHIYDFGSLSADTESLYIKAMLRKQLEMYAGEEGPNDLGPMGFTAAYYAPLSAFDEFVEVYSELICAAQECVRSLAEGERSTASLRDVSRCVKVFMWFGEHLANTVGQREGWDMSHFFGIKPKAQKYIRKAVILSLAYCYHARLPRAERRVLVNEITSKWRSFQVVANPYYGGGGALYGGGGFYVARNKARCRWLNLDTSAFISILEETQREFVSVMNLGDGIALNEALCENLFMILCSVLNSIPIFVIGKPGSSKSLAMGLIQSNLNGDASDNEFLKSLPAVEVFSYQCSPLSTSAGIEQAFESARRYRKEASNTVVVVLLDEVGLAEQSPHLPLKVLHKMLDEAVACESVVGISNWSLDPAKMNRAVHLYRPAPTVEDLSLTAEGMVRSANLKGYLHELARAYNYVYSKQIHPDFWGLREFYSTVRAINNALSKKKEDNKSGDAVALDSVMLMNAVLRNFGGRPDEMETIMKCFFDRVGLPLSHTWKNVLIESLIVQNLRESEARHLMLLTKNNAALSLLLDRSIIQQDATEIIFGSDFPLDQNDLQICINIQRVKLCMSEGITVVLVHCESLYESLYDLLNQHYVEYGGQTYVRLAFGSYTRLCPIHSTFRVIVIVEKEEAYTKLAPPLLNRFEKQVFERANVLQGMQVRVLARLERFAKAFVMSGITASSMDRSEWSILRAAFSGYHTDMLSSLILAAGRVVQEEAENGEVSTSSGVDPDTVLFQECVRRLLWIATPEAACRLMISQSGEKVKEILRDYDVDCAGEYFQRQCHSSLSAFAERMLQEWSDALGSQLILMTYSALSHDVADTIRDKGYSVAHVVLHELDQERVLRQHVTDFFKTATDGSTLLVQCDPLATSRRRIEHTKFLIELIRARKLKEKTAAAEVAVVDGEDDAAANTTTSVKGIHIILLVHLPRGDSSQEATYCVDFDTRWRVAFVDAIQSANTSGLPDAENIIGRTVSDIYSSLDARKVLSKVFRSALSRMDCAYHRSNHDVHREIVNVTKCLQSVEYVEIVNATMQKMMTNKFGGLDIDVTLSALNERELQIAGSFQAALHRQIFDIISCLYAVILSHQNRNNNLALFLNSKWTEMWSYLFKQSWNEMQLLSTLKSRRGKHSQVKSSHDFVVEAKSDNFGGSGTFVAHFPFSHFLSSVIDSMRKVTESSSEDHLHRQFATLAFEHGLSEAMDGSKIEDYVHDMVCSKCRLVASLDREAQTALVLHIINHMPVLKAVGEEEEGGASESKQSGSSSGLHSSLETYICPVSLITQVHHRFWHVERILDLYFEVMDSGVAPLEEFTSLLTSISEMSTSTHFDMLNVVIRNIHLKAVAPSTSACATAYKDWFKLIHRVRSPFLALVDLLSDDNQRHDILLLWKKYDIFHTLVRDVGVPLNINAEHLVDFMIKFDGISFVSSESLRAVLSTLNHLYAEYWPVDGVPHEFICPITQERMTNPVIASDGHSYDRVAIQEWFDMGRDTSPMTNQPLRNKELIPNDSLRERLNNITGFELQRFLEHFIVEVIFAPMSRASLDSALIEDILCITSGDPITVGETVIKTVNLLPSSGAVEGILKELIKLNIFQDRVDSAASLDRRLLDSVQKKGYLDTPLCSAYTLAAEDLIPRDTALSQAAKGRFFQDVNALGLATVRPALDSVALCRFILSKYASRIVDMSAVESTDSSILDSECTQLAIDVNTLLEDAGSLSVEMTRSMRVYFLKHLEKSRGLSFVRNVLMQRPLVEASWLKQWRESDDVAFTRFLGSSKLPRINPFLVFPGYTDVQSVLSEFMQSGNVDVMEEGFRRLHASRKANQIGAAILLASFHEISLLSLLPSSNTTTVRTRCVDLQRWLLTSTGAIGSLPITQRRAIVYVGLGNFSVSERISDGEDVSSLGLEENSTMDTILRLRVIAHVIATSIYIDDPNHPFAFLHTLEFTPDRLSSSYFPTMPEDVTKMAQKVMGGRWYACPNGHPFYVDLCGRPTVIQVFVMYCIFTYCGRSDVVSEKVCAECGARIGGENHDLLADNVDLGNVGRDYYKTTDLQDNSERKYCVRSAEEEFKDRFYTSRALNAMSIRAIRVLLHSAMFGGICLQSRTWSTLARDIFNSGFCKPDNCKLFVLQNLKTDWDLLRTFTSRSTDEVALIMHLIINDSISLLSPESGQTGTKMDILTTSSARDLWEDRVDKNLISRFNTGDGNERAAIDTLLRVTHEQYGGDASGDVASAFAVELLERVSVHTFSPSDRRMSAPQLWRMSTKFSYDDFLVTLQQVPHASEKYPLLSMVTSQDKDQLLVLRHIPEVLEWFMMLHGRYNGRIDRDTARATKNSDVIQDLAGDSVTSLHKVNSVFGGYMAAFNHSWANVKRFGCIQFASDFNQLVMGPDAAMSFSLPNEVDEGNCPLALAQYLIEKHNAFVQIADETALLMKMRKGRHVDDDSFSRAQFVSSKFISSAHTIRCSVENDLIPLLEKHCVVEGVSVGGYDFAKAERIILDRFFADIPAIDMEMPGFTFLHEQHLKGGMAALRQKIKQEPIPDDVVRAITREINTPARAQVLLELIEQVASFVSATGGSYVQNLSDDLANMLLTKYVKTVLLVDEDIGCRVIAQQARLKHLEDLWSVLTEIASCDVFGKVHAAYKGELSSRSRKDLLGCIQDERFKVGKILGVMKTFMIESLQEKVISSEAPVDICLENMEVDDMLLADTQWFLDTFPSSLKMSEIVEAYNLIKNFQQ